MGRNWKRAQVRHRASSLPDIIYRDEIVNVDWVLPISPEDLAAVRDGKKNIFVWGGANYRDAFKEDRFFKFRAINGPDLGNRFALKPHKLGYEAN